MSDPVTNVEIEDVLSSIRKLVSDGDKARTRDPAPVAAPQLEPSAQAPEPAVTPQSDSKPDKLVLTPAFLVPGAEDAQTAMDHEQPAPADSNDNHVAEASEDGAADGDTNDMTAAFDDAEVQDQQAEASDPPPQEDGLAVEALARDVDPMDGHDEDANAEVDDTAGQGTSPHDPEMTVAEADEVINDEAVDDGPIQLTEMVWQPQEPQAEAPAAKSDRSELVATIAELEAAVSRSSSEYEPDGSEVMGETIAWPGTNDRAQPDAEEAQTVAPDAASGDDEGLDAGSVDAIEPQDSPFAFPTQDDDDTADSDAAHADDDADDLDGLLDVCTGAIDEDALREMVSEIVREELTGPMGERITRNVRKLVRREIYRILSSQEFE